MASTKRIEKQLTKEAEAKARFSDYSAKKTSNLLDRVEARINEAEAKVKDIERAGIEVSRRWSKEKELAKLEKYRKKFEKKGKLTWRELWYLNDTAKKNTFNDITWVILPVPDKRHPNAEIPKEEAFTISKIEKVVREDIAHFDDETKKAPSEKMRDAINKWNEITRIYKSSNEIGLAGKSEAEAQAIIKSRTGAGELNLGYGGHSALINDLWYIARANGVTNNLGENLVRYIKSYMTDKSNFAKIERFYQSSEGYELRNLINNATGRNLYKYVCMIYEAFNKLIDKVGVLTGTTDEQKALREQTEAGISSLND